MPIATTPQLQLCRGGVFFDANIDWIDHVASVLLCISPSLFFVYIYSNRCVHFAADFISFESGKKTGIIANDRLSVVYWMQAKKDSPCIKMRAPVVYIASNCAENCKPNANTLIARARCNNNKQQPGQKSSINIECTHQIVLSILIWLFFLPFSCVCLFLNECEMVRRVVF